jgi:hypothetical protein
MPGPAVFLLFGELRLFEAIWQLTTGRRDVHPGQVGIGYARGRLVVELVFVAGALIELVAVDLLVPWDRLGDYDWLRIVVLLASLYGVIWIALWMISERTRPHLATDDALVLRWGHLPIATVPWTIIREVREHRRYTADDARLSHDIPLQGTNLDIELSEPLDARIPFRRRHRQVTGISLGVDDPDTAAAVIRGRIPMRPPEAP